MPGIIFPVPAQTGLPHTALYPRAEDEEADWVYRAAKLGVTGATRTDWIKAHADYACAAWRARNHVSAVGLARSSFPGLIRAGRSVQPASPAAGRARQNPSYQARGRGR